MENSFKKVKSYKRRLPKIKRRLLKHLWIVRGSLLAGFLLFLLVVYFVISVFARHFGLDRYGRIASAFLLSPTEKIQNINEVTNILILGKGGENHEAPELTDTMMIASFNHKEKRITLISLPRDIWIPEIRSKINGAYFWGNEKQDGGGTLLAASLVEQISGIPIHYVTVIDFSGFERIIDAVDGVDVEILTSFTDEKYPITGKENEVCPRLSDGSFDNEYSCRYESVHFETGIEHMDGERALVFVRSRHAEGDEGTDFARARRQQQVLKALQKKMTSFEVLAHPAKIRKILAVVDSSVQTDFDSVEGAILARTLFNSRNAIDSYVLPETFLDNPPLIPEYDNLYVFIPKGETWTSVHEWTKCILEKRSDCITDE